MKGFLAGQWGTLALLTTLFAGTGAHADTCACSKVMVAGGTLQLIHLAAINPDCTSLGAIHVRVTSGPSSGRIRTVQRADFAHFKDAYAQCNSRKVPGLTVYYTPENGFIGTDAVQLDEIFPNGAERNATYTIIVK